VEDQLKGRVAVVTGGAGGLGRATCLTLAEAGARVVIADVRLEPAEKLAAELAENGLEADALQLDLRREPSIETAVAQVVDRHGSIDVLVNNAGVDYTLAFDELSLEQWDHVMDVNLRGPFLLSKHVFEVMRAVGRGHIVNVASTAAKRAWPNASAYHASKWGLLGLSHAMHSEARLVGVKVTAIVAGGMKTPFLLDRFPDIDTSTLQDPANVAATIRFVLSQPAETVIPEVMVLPMKETSWP
jgi:NAD(P)-dependent dehydrogenase (short-subunit alcohol dehydrogenase family)